MGTSGKRFIQLGLLLGLASQMACGGGGGSSPTTPTVPPAPTKATITVTAATPTVALSSRRGFTYVVAVASTIAESAGVGANINFVRMQFIRAGLEIERQEISSADLIVQTGSNRLAASSTRTLNLSFDTNAETATSALLTFNFTDDRGNNLESSFTVTF